MGWAGGGRGLPLLCLPVRRTGQQLSVLRRSCVEWQKSAAAAGSNDDRRAWWQSGARARQTSKTTVECVGTVDGESESAIAVSAV